jgi:hypothetical protein
MVLQTAPTATPTQLLKMSDGAVIQQALYAAATLGIADLLENHPRDASDLASELHVNGAALLRVLRLLASQGVFEEISPAVFTNTELSEFLRTGIKGSVRSLVIFRGSEFFYAPFGEILYSVETGRPAREKLCGMSAFEYLKQNLELARIFDDAMTNMAELIAPAVARGYDFGAWGSLMDIGGGNGILLATILKAHASLHGVLADLPHVLERARARGFLSGELEARSNFQFCDFFQEVPGGCRAYLMKSVIHDWDDERAHRILVNCRQAIPDDGALLLIERALPERNVPSQTRYTDLAMLVLTGGKERTIEEYRHLLAGAGFRLNRVVPVPGDFCIIESLPV